ncbi:FkbM family methyltransferase [Streptomyces sp. AV19]|uniref:FkbM family methyltransferase n=1 Tax=Streptomyces sp. AV19 TaxID=2793068 RepID=UPI0018FEB260|nr:FkbM family methyltransferase [Streptomyces sp. AV19]MBH1937771.1 FkbM family methyltransferase [Streptomyces sp. AV19]MDG4533659.1 FkbM family methyltransferase [Streptomyces sp. AV19]
METMQLPNGLTVHHMNAVETEFLYREIFVERCYARNGIALNRGDVVFDVGANIGLAALFFHKECPGLTFHAFEPGPGPYGALKANIAAHGIDAEATQCAISDRPGTAPLTYFPQCTAASGFHPDLEEQVAVGRAVLLNSGFRAEDVDAMEADYQAQWNPETVESPVHTLSEVIAERNVASIGLLKVDVEKSELQVLQGLTDEDWPKVRQCVVEVHDIDGRLRTILSLLTEHGFATALEQDLVFKGTEIHTVYARRREA